MKYDDCLDENEIDYEDEDQFGFNDKDNERVDLLRDSVVEGEIEAKENANLLNYSTR